MCIAMNPDPPGNPASGDSCRDSKPVPDLEGTDFPPALQETLRQKLEEEADDSQESLTEWRFKRALQKVARRKKSD